MSSWTSLHLGLPLGLPDWIQLHHVSGDNSAHLLKNTHSQMEKKPNINWTLILDILIDYFNLTSTFEFMEKQIVAKPSGLTLSSKW